MSDSYASSRNGDANGHADDASPISAGNQAAAMSNVIRKKLMGYVGFANLPNQVHRKSVRKGFHFTAMVVGVYFSFFLRHAAAYATSASLGESGLGKSTLVNTLFNTSLFPVKKQWPPSAERPKTVSVESISAGQYQSYIFRPGNLTANASST